MGQFTEAVGDASSRDVGAVVKGLKAIADLAKDVSKRVRLLAAGACRGAYELGLLRFNFSLRFGALLLT